VNNRIPLHAASVIRVFCLWFSASDACRPYFYPFFLQVQHRSSLFFAIASPGVDMPFYMKIQKLLRICKIGTVYNALWMLLVLEGESMLLYEIFWNDVSQNTGGNGDYQPIPTAIWAAFCVMSPTLWARRGPARAGPHPYRPLHPEPAEGYGQPPAPSSSPRPSDSTVLCGGCSFTCCPPICVVFC